MENQHSRRPVTVEQWQHRRRSDPTSDRVVAPGSGPFVGQKVVADARPPRTERRSGQPASLWELLGNRKLRPPHLVGARAGRGDNTKIYRVALGQRDSRGAKLRTL